MSSATVGYFSLESEFSTGKNFEVSFCGGGEFEDSRDGGVLKVVVKESLEHQ